MELSLHKTCWCWFFRPVFVWLGSLFSPLPFLKSKKASCSHTKQMQQLWHTKSPPITLRTQQQNKKCRLTQTAFLISISIYCSHHTNLYKNRGFAASRSKETRSCLWVADLKETGAFYSHVSQLQRVCCLIFKHVLPKTLQESKAAATAVEPVENPSLRGGRVYLSCLIVSHLCILDHRGFTENLDKWQIRTCKWNYSQSLLRKHFRYILSSRLS